MPSAPPLPIEARPSQFNATGGENSTSSGQKTEKLGRRVGKYWVFPDGFMENIKTNRKLRGVIGTNVPQSQSQEIYIGRIPVGENVDFNILGHYIERKCKIKVINCYELNCRDPKFKSFKVIVNKKDSNKLFNAKLWASGTEVREFVTANYIRDIHSYNHA